MFAVIKTGGKQYKVAEGDVLRVEKLEFKDGNVVFDEVLLVVNGEVKLGKPVVSGAKVTAKVLEEGKGEKKMVFRYKSKTRQHKKKGHRQPYTKIQITKITLS
ncbi:MAG: 50S ribosomal protein L21 [Patescibacteria group bacterium]